MTGEGTIPAGATDCHAHVFGPFARFPLAVQRHYTPPELDGARYLRALDSLGFSRGVLVQATAHGTDCGAMLHALTLDRARLRGIAVVQPDISDAALAAMHDGGVRGVRFSRPPGGLDRGAVGFDAFERMAPRLVNLGLHAQLWSSCDELIEWAPRLTALGVPLVIDHTGMFDVEHGVNASSFQALLRLLGEGSIWLKLIAYRLSARFPDYEDILPFHRAVLAANPERLVWGSDWPHVHMADHRPDTAHLVDLFVGWTADTDVRRHILVDNPAALYGF